MAIAKELRKRIKRAARSLIASGRRRSLESALRQSENLIDPLWYRRANGVDVKTAGEALEHYVSQGWRHGLDPNPLFDTNWYRTAYRKKLRRDLLDPLTHFVMYGWREDCRPNPFFSPKGYLARVPESANHPLGPLAHYLDTGARAHVAIDEVFDSRWYEAKHMGRDAWPDVPLAHYARVGAYRGLAPGPGMAASDGRTASAECRAEVQRTYTRMISSAGPASIRENTLELPRPFVGTNGRIAVYTAIMGDYDTLKLPYPEWTGRADFFCFTDRMFTERGAWRLVRPDYHSIDPTRIARFYKTHPHVFFSSYEFAIWIDGNVGLRVDPASLVDGLDHGLDVVAFRHSRRQRLEEEALQCIARARDDANIVRAQLKRYADSRYDQRSPLMETNVMIFRPGRPSVGAFMSRWWSEIDRGSKRDQLSVNYSLDATPGLAIGYFGEATARRSPRFLVVKHD